MNLKKILKNDERIWDEDVLDYPLLFELARTYDKDLLEILFNNKESKKKFFIQVGDSHIFKYNEFRFYLEENQVNNSFTQYANKIGLASQGEHLSDSTDYVLDWPYKDCVLEGGMSSEEDMDVYIKRDENTTPVKMDKKTGTMISPEKTEVTFSQAKRKREEIFYNNIIADKEIDRLLDKKALKNFTRYTAKGEEKVQEIKRDEDGTIKENLLIKGNNLLALHSLKEQFAGKVKLIYIDPPYNTGNDGFVYNDRFNHSTWLTFMKNRLEVAKEFLREDGVIFVQCDDTEQAYLKVMMDQIFGRGNFESIVWKKKGGAGNTEKIIGNLTEYVLCYFINKKPGVLNYRTLSREYKFSDKNGPYNLEGIEKTNLGTYERKTMLFDIKNPKTGSIFKPPKDKRWTIGKDNIEKLIHEEKIFFDEDKKKVYRIKRPEDYEASNTVYNNLLLEHGSLKQAKNELEKIFENREIFSTPKPEKLMYELISLATSKGDIVMDFHLGSGTTTAVAHKMERQYIGIEQIDYISDVSVPRMIEVLNGEKGGISNQVGWKGGGDFIYFKLAEYNEEAKNQIDECKSYKELKKLFTQLTEYYFLNYNVSVQQFNNEILEDKDFHELTLQEQKTLFKALLDNNQLYIPYAEQEDGKYNLSKEDQELTNRFYG